MVGWAEFNEGSDCKTLASLIRAIGEPLIVAEPLPVQQIAADVRVGTDGVASSGARTVRGLPFRRGLAAGGAGSGELTSSPGSGAMLGE